MWRALANPVSIPGVNPEISSATCFQVIPLSVRLSSSAACSAGTFQRRIRSGGVRGRILSGEFGAGWFVTKLSGVRPSHVNINRTQLPSTEVRFSIPAIVEGLSGCPGNPRTELLISRATPCQLSPRASRCSSRAA